MKREMQGCCYDCARLYGDEYGFPDLIVPNDVWAKIAPVDGNGLLCPSCICRRLALLEIETIGTFVSGPLCETKPLTVGKTMKDVVAAEAAKEKP